MNNDNPRIVIEDDQDDQDLLKEIFKKLAYKNEVIFFHDGNMVLEYLDKSEVVHFLILSDINMPKMTGFELKNKILLNEKLQRKSIPYLFFTTNANEKAVVDAYSMSVQGFFVKPNTIEEFERVIKNIMEYWKDCISPNVYK